MAVTIIPNVTNWGVTPQNGQVGYFTLMNTWLSESTAVIASLQTAIDAQNAANSEINALSIQVANNATVATGLANFQGAWSSIITYSKGQSIESTTGSKIYYISKVDSNLNHSVTDTNYWLYNPINDKLDKDFSALADKTTPADSDIFATRETGGLLKKLSWANIKASLDSLYVKLTGNQTIAGVKTFSSSPIVPTPTTNNQVANKAYVDSKAIGEGQTWQDVTSSRAVATTYTNTTGRTIHVLISANCNTLATFEVSGGSINVQDTSSALSVVSAPIPSGGTYRLSGGSELKWLELR